MRLILSAILAALVVSFANGAYAGTFVVKGTVTEVKPNYVSVQIPDHQRQCQMIDIPIYGQSQPNNGNAILGAIIGGVIGNQFGKGDGNKAATAAGAAIGAVKGSQMQGDRPIVGYKREERCNMVERFRYEEKVRDYTVKYNYNGYYGSVVTYNQFSVGDKITLQMDLRAK